MATADNKKTPPAKPRAWSLLIALNAVSSNACSGWSGRLKALIRAGMPPTRSPKLLTLGQASRLLAQTPFTV